MKFSPFGEALRKARRDAKETLLTLAEASNLSVAYVSQVERGDKNPPNDNVIRLWLKALGKESLLSEFRELARQSIKCFQISTSGKSEAATNVLTALARSYDSKEVPDDVWREVERVLEEKGIKK